MADKSVVDELCTASAMGNLPEVLSLLEKGADVNGLNKFGRTALQVVMLGSTPVIEVLLKAGADPDRRDQVCGLTVTHDAARQGFVDSVRLLLDYRADPNLCDYKNNLPLHLAAMWGRLEVVKVLIGRTADPQTPNCQGRTARQLAEDAGHADIVGYIHEYLNSH
ncbi:cyclin-dependent kinase 4 inhibitor C [Larimichthys crocea]|uniref:cyclin-dependent kinase 4 inhibitor C n=1 Tax=Larimichthys crocea TaxID=215358 RepID=UPI000F60386F|nr:cyclin-dependent kinase 4 inhibitor C [Larimichthys crocea]XP_019118320.2 cyclin-dependent kinase 4 inhibitor C [Larimichthys crocea]